MPDMIYSDRDSNIFSTETTNYLHGKGIATSKTSRYNLGCKSQTEKLNGTLWKGVQVTLHSYELGLSEWKAILPDVLQSTSYLLCPATNTTSHKRLFDFPR